MLRDGLYEQVINQQIKAQLESDERYKETNAIDKAEASKVLTQYLAPIIEQSLESVKGNEKEKLGNQVSVVNQIVDTLSSAVQGVSREELAVPTDAEQLLALFEKQNSILALDGGKARRVSRPETSIAQSSLFTGAPDEPQMYDELKKEILSCNRIDMLVSFIKWSGLRLIIEELRQFATNGGRLRIITTSYMGATDIRAIEELSKLPNTQIKVSYDTKRTRLHAKTYVFYRDSGFTTAYVGSSNLSNAAITSGLEWNVKVTRADLPDTIDKIAATFESYWSSNEFEHYDENRRDQLEQALRAERNAGGDANSTNPFVMDIHPYPFQQEILEKLEAERTVRQQYRNLVVAATGTGKTVISAFDYKRFCQQHPGEVNRLLFVAHREEILEQSINTFRAVLKDPNFGELFVGNNRPNSLDHLFISIQTFNSQHFAEKTTADYYDFVVVDEFHHAAARSYQKLLTRYEPQILLGLTATPERMDGRNVQEYFNNRIAAEIRLPEAIERKLLCPFQYFGVTDTIDLSEIKWTRGGYDISELSNVYSLSGHIAERRAAHIADSLYKYVTDMNEVKGLGFCVSIEHAEFMARFFNEHGIPSIALTGKSGDEERDTAKQRLVSGEIRFIFVVDIYNEGVDIPEVNTILFLRPTESLTVFLQQLGRGLRLAEGKECLTVLDFIGKANKKFSFESRFKALMANTKRTVYQEVSQGFNGLPKGCYIQLEKEAQRSVLENIRAAYERAKGLAHLLVDFQEETGQEPTLTNFLNHYRLGPRDVYRFKDVSFSQLLVDAGLIDDFDEPAKEEVTKGLKRLCFMDSRRLITFLLNTLPHENDPKPIRIVDIDGRTHLGVRAIADMTPNEQRMLQMFYVTVWKKAAEDWESQEVRDNLKALVDSPTMLGEIRELLEYQYSKIDFVDQPVDLGFDCPLDVHCTYTRYQALAALDFLKLSSSREGVMWLPDKNADVFFITINKSDKDYSPTTMYHDYSISPTLFHWQSQSTTPDTSPTSQRYIHHEELGSKVLLFVRENKEDELLDMAAPYTFLGEARYVSHEGSNPMSIVWEMEHAIPAKYLKSTNKLTA